ADELGRPSGIAVVAVLLDFRDGILQAIKIQNFAVAVNEIADASDALALQLEQVGNGAAGVAGGVQDLERKALPVQSVTPLDGGGLRQRLGQDAAALLLIVWKRLV